MWRLFTFCQCFFSSDTRKFMAKWMFWTSSSSPISTLPTATLRHRTFFIWNLMVDLRSRAFCSRLSLWVTRVGNLPALKRKDLKYLKENKTSTIPSPC